MSVCRNPHMHACGHTHAHVLYFCRVVTIWTICSFLAGEEIIGAGGQAYSVRETSTAGNLFCFVCQADISNLFCFVCQADISNLFCFVCQADITNADSSDPHPAFCLKIPLSKTQQITCTYFL